jgi:hypothetical protein
LSPRRFQNPAQALRNRAHAQRGFGAIHGNRKAEAVAGFAGIALGLLPGAPAKLLFQAE